MNQYRNHLVHVPSAQRQHCYAFVGSGIVRVADRLHRRTTSLPLMRALLFAIVVLLIAPVWAAEHFVALSGADGNNGQTVSTAWRTINHALATVPAGTASNPSVIRVAAGTYAGETDGTYWKLNFRSKAYVHVIGASAAQTIVTRGTKQWEMNGGTGIVDLNGCTGARFEGMRIVMDTYPSIWDANVIRINSPNDVTLRDVWIDGPYTAPADRSGRRVALYGTAGAGGLVIAQCCFSGGGLAFWLGVLGSSCTIDIDHVTITDYATTRTDDNGAFFDQRTAGDATSVRVRNSIFNALTRGIFASTPTNRFGYLYQVESNSYNALPLGFVNQQVWYTNANEELAPDYFTMADGRAYVTRNTENGWYYHPGSTGLTPVITFPREDVVGWTNSLIAFTVQATDPDTPLTALVFSAANVPAGAVFNPTNQQFSWQTSVGDTGVYPNVTFAVNDGESADSVSISIYVLGGPITRYYARTNGLNSAARTGLSVAQAWKTITYALTRVAGGNKYAHNVLDVGAGDFADERSGLQGRANNWQLNLAGVQNLDIIGAGPALTRIVQGTNSIWEVDSIVRLYNAAHVRVSGLQIPVTVSSDLFDVACIRIDACADIVLDNLWLCGPREPAVRNGHGVYVSGVTGAGGVTLERVLIEGFGQGFYTTAQGGWAHSNVLRYCTIAEQDGSFDIDDGLGVWHRAGTGIGGNHLRAERCIFANEPACRTNSGAGMRVDNSMNINDDLQVILYSYENNYYNCGPDGLDWYQPDLSQLEDNSATNDVSFDPQFYTNSFNLPYCADIDYGWQPVPEVGALGLLIIIAGVVCRRGEATRNT